MDTGRVGPYKHPGVHLNTQLSHLLGCGLPGRQRLCPGQEEAGQIDEEGQLRPGLLPGLSGGCRGQEDGS